MKRFMKSAISLSALLALSLVCGTNPAAAQVSSRLQKSLHIDNPSAPVEKASSPMGRPNRLPQLRLLGDKMAEYLQEQVNARRRIGGGECAHLATEALRIAGAEFLRPEPKGTMDYVWT